MSDRRRSLPEITPHTKRTWHRIREDYSAGGVAYRPRAQGPGVEIALIATRQRTRWQLPKGSLEPHESSLETALREVHEEVGLETVNEGFLKTIDYWYWDTYRKEVPELVHKRVDFYLLRAVGGTISDACHEVDDAAWFTPEEALSIMTFEGEKEVVRLAMERLHGRES
ncbi:NUDIX hydrolase [Litorilinea aerophila]|uniref:NUDIX hydrolase n=1 Tax=Litorilinea aerophila TaxID=1204385 RepID=A0A540VHI2_9CHLR|nr:NUDIX hydrolase [Litorilinea aerophila]MCC9076266.1 NUDIX hydrolase [Litorilinea aerophila]